MMPGRRANEVTALLGENVGNRLCILPPQSLSGEDHHSGVDVPGMQARGRIGLIDNASECSIVDAFIVLIGGERDLRLEQCFS